MRENKMKLNNIFGIINQLVVIISGLILPRMILIMYGSEINGLVNSVTGLLSVITLLECGVGAVTQSELYKPLVNNCIEDISKIYYASKKFYKGIGYIFILFTIIAGVVLSFLEINNFSFLFTFLLVLAMSISFFSQYYFGIFNSLLIKADQKSYIVYIIQFTTIIINTIICCLLMKHNCSIQIIQLATSIIYLIRPLFFSIYVKRKYKLVLVKLKGNELEQKWNALAQHIAAYILNNTDIIIITIFSNLMNVSIYSVYYMVVKAVFNIVKSLIDNLMPYFGKFIANEDQENLKKSFDKYTYLICLLSTVVFSITIITIVPFVMVYTKGVDDACYYQPLFAILLVVSHIVMIYRSILITVVNAANHYRQTQKEAIIECCINIVLSIVLINFAGIIGVALGTLIAVSYRAVSLSIYVSKRIIKKSHNIIIKQVILMFFSVLVSIVVSYYFNFIPVNYIEWILFAIKSGIFVLILMFILIILIDRKKIITIIKRHIK